jgi:HD-GYP domain-containing protein (c-di-GMP phosphodiesterase class II)
MTSDRTYRSALTQADALAELLRCSGSQFDPAIIEVLCSIVTAERAPLAHPEPSA